MACSLPQAQQQPPQYHQPTIYTTFIPFTDYSQWERRPLKPQTGLKHSLPNKGKPPSLLKVDSTKGCRHTGSCYSAKGSVVVRSRPPPGGSGGLRGIERRLVSGGTRLPTSTYRSQEAAKLRLLRLQLSSKKASIEDVRTHSEELLSMNLSLIKNIQQLETCTHLNVDDMLGKYLKFKGAISKLKIKSSEQLCVAKEELAKTRVKLEAELSELRKTAAKTKSSLQKKSQDLQMFLTYKEKEYPIKIVRMEQLKEQIELMRERCEEERLEIELEIAEERDKCQQQLDAIQQTLEKRATEASLAHMKKSIHEKAIQNRIMEKEIILHEKKRAELQEAISTLTSDINKLKQSANHSSESRRQLPLAKLGKCTPNTEFMLDIPRQEPFLL